MATKKCPNGHIYDPNVYGDNCPFCPSGDTVNLGGGKTKVNDGTYSDDTGGTKKTEPIIGQDRLDLYPGSSRSLSKTEPISGEV